MSKPTYTEVEAKFYVADLAGLKTRLAAAGAELVAARVLEHNLRFDTDGDKLKQARQVLRLRKDAQVKITFKGPIDDQAELSTRQEIEIALDDYDAGKELLEALGYEVKVVYEKYRTTYSLAGLNWMLDELPFGDFVEIEGREAAEIQAAAQALGLDWERRVKHGYLYLFGRVKDILGLQFRDLTFDNFEGLAVRPEDLGVSAADQ